MENLLLSYAKDLDDAYPGYEFSIWDREQLLNYFNDALCLIAANRPEMFTEIKVIKVDNCSSYLNTCDCVRIYDVLGQSDKHGRHIRPLTRHVTKNAVWKGNKRSQGFANEITDYEILSGSNLVKIYPENLDPNKNFYVAVRCVVEPKVYTLSDNAPDERCAFLAIARHWVLYNAKMVDGEFSNAMQAQAQEHRQMFLGLLGLIKQSDDEYEKESKEERKNKRG